MLANAFLMNGPSYRLEDLTVLDPAPGLLAQKGDRIAITPANGSMWGKGATCRNILLQPEGKEFKEAEVTVYFAPNTQGEQAGIVLFKDYDNYIKLVREFVGGRNVIVLAQEVDGNPTVLSNVGYEFDTVHLKLQVSNGSYTAAWGQSKKDLAEAGPLPLPKVFAEAARFGIFTHGKNDKNVAELEGFILR